MNCLNSVIIEGTLETGPESGFSDMGVPFCVFVIASVRFHKHGAEIKREVSYFRVEADAKLEKLVMAEGRKGRSIRIVGRLEEKDSEVLIRAEYIEFNRETTSEYEEYVRAGL
jgi:single-strand DNA-binding protein